MNVVTVISVTRVLCKHSQTRSRDVKIKQKFTILIFCVLLGVLVQIFHWLFQTFHFLMGVS